MSQEDGTYGSGKHPDAQDAKSKLNKLIAFQFEENTASCSMNSDDISLQSVLKEVIASAAKVIIKDPVDSIDDNKDAVIAPEVTVATSSPQKQDSGVVSEKQYLDQQWKQKLNELAATSFAEVPYQSYELQLEEPKPLQESNVTASNSYASPPAPMFTEAVVSPQVAYLAVSRKEQSPSEKTHHVPVTIQSQKNENIVPPIKEEQKEEAAPYSGKHMHTSGHSVKENIKDTGRISTKTEDMVSIIEVLDAIESKMKVKEFSENKHMHMAIHENISSTVQIISDAELPLVDTSPHNNSQNNTATKVAVLYSEAHTAHTPKNTNIEIPERPERLTRAMVYLQRNGVFGEKCDLITGKYSASEKDLLLVHSDEYVKFVKSYSASGGGFLGDSTYMTSSTFEVAGLAVGSAIQAAELVLSGQYSAAMAIVRPPGHHAGVDKYRGFCIFNNIAVLARYLQKKKGISKIMIIDWDAHAGDGTMEIFYNDPTVMVVSLHRDPHDFYPRRGFSAQIGEGPGKGYTANMEMPIGAGDDEYTFAFDKLVMPLLHRFSPDFVLCSCGFDAYYKEQHIKLNLTSAGYHMMTKKIMSVMNGNFVLVMEGGYHKFNGHLIHVVINSLLGLTDPVSDALKPTEYERNQQKLVMKETEKKVASLRELLEIQGD